jgi:AcrR family transcriptional regulator
MRKVASPAGISPTVIYSHFATKEALHHQMLRQGFGTLDSSLQRALAGKSPIERLDLAAGQFFTFAVSRQSITLDTLISIISY